MHAALDGFRLPPGIHWHRRVGYAEDVDLPVCHLDLHAPNIVFREGKPVGFIDWDAAGPAPRSWEIARAAWLLVPLSADERCASKGWSEPPDRLHRLRIFCDAYGLEAEARENFAESAIRMAQAHADQVKTAAEEGVPSARWLVEEVGYLRIAERDFTWMRRMSDAINAALTA
jgi:aminoglycoside phosphotransferase (APT) family kinase protein